MVLSYERNGITSVRLCQKSFEIFLRHTGGALASKINFPQLAKLVRAQRGGRGLRETAEQIGDVSPSTLSRIEGERINDMTMSTFLRVCDWLEVDPAGLLIVPETAKSAELSEADAIELQLRAARDLSPQTVNLLAEFIRIAYREEHRQRKETDG